MKTARNILLAFLFAASCTDEDATEKALRVSGYKNIQTTGYDFWGCGKDDGTCTGFVATAPNGERVTGAVSCGLWGCSKHCTVRISQ